MSKKPTVEFVPVSTQRHEWATEHAQLVAARQQFDSRHGEEHAFDAAGHHYVAKIGDTIAGYLCVDHEGHLSVALTQTAHAKNIIDSLLRQAVMDSPRRGLSQLFAPSRHPWHESLLTMGFAPQDNAGKSTISLLLPPDRTANATGSELVRLEKIDDFRHFAVVLATQARRSLALFSEDLESWLYDNDAFIEALMTLAQRQQSRIQLLVRDTRAILEHGHSLLRASHRASDKILLRKLPFTMTEKYPNYLIVDDNGLLLRPDPQIIQGIGYTDYRARVKPLLEQFEQLWERSSTDPDLRRYSI